MDISILKNCNHGSISPYMLLLCTRLCGCTAAFTASRMGNASKRQWGNVTCGSVAQFTFSFFAQFTFSLPSVFGRSQNHIFMLAKCMIAPVSPQAHFWDPHGPRAKPRFLSNCNYLSFERAARILPDQCK